MFSQIPILSIIIFVPCIGALLILFCAQGDKQTVEVNSKWGALWAAVSNFLLVIWLLIDFDTSTPDFQFVEKVTWLPQYGISYHVGIDGFSIVFILLTAILTPICILASWISIESRVKEYMISFLILESFMIGMFCSLDLLQFYIFFEAVLIPMFIIIGVWGGPRRVYAAFKLFLYTLLGSVLMLLAILKIYFETSTTSIPDLITYQFDPAIQPWLWLAFMASFAVKIPMWPVHTWLPDAHVEAPTAGSVILAGVLLKFGGYGFLRFSLPMFPEATFMFAPLVFILSIIAIIYASLIAFAQTDMKKLIAYSSVAHMGLVTAGIFSLNTQGIEGAVYQMLSHGIVSAALFLVVGVIYDRTHSREIDTYGGLVKPMPAYSLIFIIFLLASIGLPGTSGFVGEILVLVGLFQAEPIVASFSATGIILSAGYMLYLYRRTIFGPIKTPELLKLQDLSIREFSIFSPLILLTLWMGLYPSPFLNLINASVSNLLTQLESSSMALSHSLSVLK